VRKVSPDGSIKALATAGENVSQSAVETTPGEGSERNVVSRRSLPYLLLGASLFALIVFIWLRRR
jgi:hypothetical protein